LLSLEFIIELLDQLFFQISVLSPNGQGRNESKLGKSRLSVFLTINICVDGGLDQLIIFVAKLEAAIVKQSNEPVSVAIILDKSLMFILSNKVINHVV